MFHTLRRRRRSLRIASLWRHVGSAALLAALLVSGNVVRATEPSPQEPDRTRDVPWLLGDWNGRRVWLQDRGLDLQLGYTGEFAFNATGGVRQQAAARETREAEVEEQRARARVAEARTEKQQADLQVQEALAEQQRAAAAAQGRGRTVNTVA